MLAGRGRRCYLASVGLHLTSDDTRRLAALTGALLTPAAGVAHVDAWWRGAEEHLRALLPGAAVMLSLPHGTQMLHLSDSIDAGLRREMATMIRVDPATGLSHTPDPGLDAWYRARRAAGLAVWNEVVNAGLLKDLGTEMGRLMWYNEALVPARMRAFSGLTTQRPTGEAFLCVGYDGRGRARRDAAEELEILRLVFPTLTAGHHAWAASHVRQAALHAQLDAIPDALLVIGPDGRPLHRNAALTRLLDAEPERDHLLGVLHAMAAELRGPRAVLALATPARTVTTALGRYALRASLAPAALWGQEGVVQLAVEPAEAPTAAATAAGATHGLTPREAQVARLLARRARDPEIAAALGISVHTARHHSEKVLRKLGVRRRTDVAAVLAAP